MELTLCAYTFLLFSVVSATPHGYGTKGGASAKAEATAGAFDGVRGLPLNIPSGPGFSGSFSKSSSSSSSSASSSASSSSSSFSYGGSGSTGLHGFGTNSGAGASSFEGENGFAGSNGLPGAKGHIEPHTLVGANAFAGSRAQAGANSLAGSHSLAGANDIAGSNASAGASGFAEGNGLVGGISDCVSGYCSNNKRDEVPTINSSGGVATGHRNSGSNVAAASNAAAGAYGFTNGAVNPAVGASPSAEELPPYTGGFGGPHGVLKPNEFDIKLPSTTYSPATSGSPSSHDFPSYTGGFGAPSGLLKPNEMSSSTNSGASANTHGVYFHTTTTPVQKVPLHQGTHVPPSGHLKPGDTKVVIPTAHLGNPVVLQPIPVIYPTHQVLPVHAHGLIAPTGSVQPNAYDTTNPSATSIIASGNIDSHGHHGHTQLPSGESNVYKDLPKYTGNFGGAPGVLKPNDFKESSNNGYIKPEVASNSKPNSCLTGTCNVESSNTVAVAKADAVAYTSGFGGPPGLLKPHDGGKLDNKLLSGAQFGLHHGSTGLLQSGVGTVNGYEVKTPAHGTYTPDATAQANAVAQAAAVAEATSGSYEGSIGQAGANGDVHKSGSGCGGGCGGGSYLGSGPDFGVNSALSSAKAGAVNGQNSGLHVDSASAKSHASAVTGARALGGSGSFASSSASAHSSAGYATKGGYGK